MFSHKPVQESGVDVTAIYTSASHQGLAVRFKAVLVMSMVEVVCGVCVFVVVRYRQTDRQTAYRLA